MSTRRSRLRCCASSCTQIAGLRARLKYCATGAGIKFANRKLSKHGGHAHPGKADTPCTISSEGWPEAGSLRQEFLPRCCNVHTMGRTHLVEDLVGQAALELAQGVLVEPQPPLQCLQCMCALNMCAIWLTIDPLRIASWSSQLRLTVLAALLCP